MGFVPRALFAGGLGFAVSCLVACGGGAGLLSGDQSSSLSGQLDSISSAVAAGRCSEVPSALTGLGNAVANLPATINPTLRANLIQGVSTVSRLAPHDCATTTHSRHTTSTTPTTSSTSTSSTTTTPSTSTSTSSTSSTTPSSTTPSSTTTPATSSTTTGTSTSGGTGGAGLGGGTTTTGGTGGTGGGAAAGNGT